MEKHTDSKEDPCATPLPKLSHEYFKTWELPMGKGLHVCVPQNWIVNSWTKKGVQKWRHAVQDGTKGVQIYK